MTAFTNKTVMITGAAGSVASGVIDKFASQGAQLVLVDYAQDRLHETVQAKGLTHATTVAADLGKPEQVKEAIRQATEAFGQIDALVHTAGGFAMGDPVHALNLDVFNKMMYINAQLTYVTCGAVAQHMLDHDVKGNMVTILAKAGLAGGKNMAAYSASKAAAERIVQSMAQELKEHHIRINGIMPSIVDTPPNREDMPNADFSKWVSPSHIGDVAFFLCSEASEAINGASLAVYHRV